MEISIDDGSVRKRIESLKSVMPAAATAAAEAAAKRLAEKLADRVRALIPNEGGWYDIYRAGVQLVEITPGNYDVTTKFTELSFDRIEAATTLLWFSGGDEVSQLLGADNPWTVDTIPAINGGFTSDIVVRPGSESEVDFHRRKQLANSTATTTILERLGKVVSASGLPVVNGKVMADVPFLARRLEHGLGGFPRTPIWSRLPAEKLKLENDADVEEAGQVVFSEELKRRLK